MSDSVKQVGTFEILTARPSRRSPRQWSADEKVRLVAEAFSGEKTVTEVARCYGLDVSQLYSWRRKALATGAVAPLPGRTRSETKAVPSPDVKFTRFDAVSSAVVEIVVGDAVVRVVGDVAADRLTTILRAVRQA